MRKPQGVASLALGYVLHWAFSPPLLNPKLELHKQSQFATLPTNIKEDSSQNQFVVRQAKRHPGYRVLSSRAL